MRELQPKGLFPKSAIPNRTPLLISSNELGIKGAQDKSSHVIRFTVASVLYLKGMPLTDIQRLLGHTTLSMTLHYLRQILPEKNTAEMMEKFLGEPEENNSPVPPDPNLPSETVRNVIAFPENVNKSFPAKNA